MARLAVCGGSAVRGLDVSLPEVVYLQRHGTDRYLLPHKIDHVANMRSLAEAGCDRVLALGSVGGLQPDLGPGTFVCPADFIALGAGPAAFDDERAHRVPAFDPGWRGRVVDTWRDGIGLQLVDGGIYWQARGPRLETQAEIRLMASHAQMVGMTIGSECIAACDAGLAYAAICVVENLANGVGKRELTMEELLAGRAANREAVAQALERLVPGLT
ncbi:MAG TPA: MTAP family purine nucleoside phosphorylase [Solirubrobacterales bacterium]|nr:MTAP family purine nucleoside phosphorylase [Solirubrobacterales bacterium]